MSNYKTLKAWDAINGASGMAYIDIDGQREALFYLKKIEAKIKKNKNEIKVLGQTGVKHKANGWSGSGSMTIYYSTSKFRELTLKYMKTGKDTYFDIYVENADTNSDIGRQSIVLRQVNLDEVSMTKLDVGSTELEEDMSFTFNDIDILESFKHPIGE